MEGTATGGSWAVVFSGLLQSIGFVISDDWILMYFCCLHISHHFLMDDEPSLNSVCNNVNARCSVTAATDVLHSIGFVLLDDWILMYFCCLRISHHSLMDEEPSLNYVCNNVNARCGVSQQQLMFYIRLVRSFQAIAFWSIFFLVCISIMNE